MVTAKTTAERQRAFKAAQALLGLVRVEFYATLAEREKISTLGGGEWIRKRINAARVK